MKTRKMPVSLGKDGGPATRSEFLIPPLRETGEDVLIGMKSGKRHARGAISYIGKEITAEDILVKIQELRCPREEEIEKINRFIEQLQRFRVGNISWPMSEQDAIDILTLISFLRRKLDGAEKV